MASIPALRSKEAIKLPLTAIYIDGVKGRK